MSSEVDGHEWGHKLGSLVCCTRCGVVRRADGKNNPCRGPVVVTPRLEETPFEQEERCDD
jgi:hypothetical protein